MEFEEWTEDGVDIRVLHLEKAEVDTLCLPGQGTKTCIWCLASLDGFECAYYDRPIPLLKQWVKGHTAAQRSGCDVVKALGKAIRYIECRTLEEVMRERPE